MFAFELGREFKLSLSEIYAVFPQAKWVFWSEKILVIEWISKEIILSRASSFGWVIKIIEIFSQQEYKNKKSIEWIFQDFLTQHQYSWKFHYWVNIFGKTHLSFKEILKISKQEIKSSWLNPRFVNTSLQNLSSVTIIKEALVKRNTDFNFIFFEWKTFIGTTIFIQDIYGYSNRDYGKSRDMHIGMLPPKLAQIMINISTREWDKRWSIYDPFVWLGTILIEAVYMWYQRVYGSDNNKKMVEVSDENLGNLENKFQFQKNIFFQNAKYIHEVDMLDSIQSIVTEWYLGEMMTQNNISLQRIQKQRDTLKDLYEWFFAWLEKKKFQWNIVLSLPFWEMDGKYLYFEEIYDIIDKYCEVQKLLPENSHYTETKSWSLLYKREKQLVWREIFFLKIRIWQKF